MLLTDLHHLPSPVPVLLVVRQSPHDEVGLHGLGAEDVVTLVGFHGAGLDAVGESVRRMN